MNLEIGYRSAEKYEDAQMRKKLMRLSSIPPKRGRQIVIFFDGSCWPNPGGKMGLGVVFREATDFKVFYANSRNPKTTYKTIKITDKFSRVINASVNNTNNTAEHAALNLALNHLKNKNLYNEHIFVFGDSEIIIKQMKKEYKLSIGKKYYSKAKENMDLLSELYEKGNMFEFIWVPRELNTLADSLSKI